MRTGLPCALIIHRTQPRIPLPHTLLRRRRRRPRHLHPIRRRILHTKTSTILRRRPKLRSPQPQLTSQLNLPRPKPTMNHRRIHELTPVSRPKLRRQRIITPHLPPPNSRGRPLITPRHHIRQRRLRHRITNNHPSPRQRIPPMRRRRHPLRRLLRLTTPHNTPPVIPQTEIRDRCPTNPIRATWRETVPSVES